MASFLRSSSSSNELSRLKEGLRLLSVSLLPEVMVEGVRSRPEREEEEPVRRKLEGEEEGLQVSIECKEKSDWVRGSEEDRLEEERQGELPNTIALPAGRRRW